MEEAFISYSDQDGKDNEHYSQNESDDLMEDAEETEETEEEISGSEVGDKPEDEEYDKFEPFLRLPAEIRCKIW